MPSKWTPLVWNPTIHESMTEELPLVSNLLPGKLIQQCFENHVAQGSMTP